MPKKKIPLSMFVVVCGWRPRTDPRPDHACVLSPRTLTVVLRNTVVFYTCLCDCVHRGRKGGCEPSKRARAFT
jgi:hypothetical protein